MTAIKTEYIVWKDHAANKYSKWMEFEDLVTEPLVINTIGFVVFEDDEVIVICHTIHPVGSTMESVQAGVSQMVGDLTILKAGIVSRKVIDNGKPTKLATTKRNRK